MYAFWAGSTFTGVHPFDHKSLYFDFYPNLSQLLPPCSLQYVIITNSHSNLHRTYVFFNIMSFVGKKFGQNFIWTFAELFLGRKYTDHA